ncbi:MAG: DUF1080 domain-containing protein [Planctomycetes bacterium]|nr:DUF1080 domain-containing protein [Planctomycetota bacterium]
MAGFVPTTGIASSVLVLATLISSPLVNAAEPVPGVSRSLFDGVSLHGWAVENDCDVDIVDGCLRLKAGHGWLRSHLSYRDFELHVEWKSLQAANYDAGIYIRAGRDGKPFPKSGHQVNLLQGKEGNISSLPGAQSSGLVKAGDWNAFDLRVVGETVSLTINGQPAYSVGGLHPSDGYIGFQVEVPNGGQFLLRNVQVVELGYRSLFNGRDFTGWEGEGGATESCWSVTDGLLVCSGQKGPWLRSTTEFGDFDLRLEYRLSTGGNSGIYVRVPKDGNHHRDNDTLPVAGFEVQVLDDAAPQHLKLKDYQYSASIYDIAGANPRVSRPPGEWNTLEINCRGQRVTTWHNGYMVTDVTSAESPLLGLRSVNGFLGLQNHSTIVKFRDLRVGPAIELPEKVAAK